MQDWRRVSLWSYTALIQVRELLAKVYFHLCQLITSDYGLCVYI